MQLFMTVNLSRIGSTAKNENTPPNVSEDREFLDSDCGRLCQKLQSSLWKNRIKFEDLILDVENLSKMSPFLEIELVGELQSLLFCQCLS